MATVVKNPPINAGDVGVLGSIPGSERSPGGGHGNPFQYSCLENPIGREVWGATLQSMGSQRVSWRRLSTCTHAHKHIHTQTLVMMGKLTRENTRITSEIVTYTIVNWHKGNNEFKDQ